MRLICQDKPKKAVEVEITAQNDEIDPFVRKIHVKFDKAAIEQAWVTKMLIYLLSGEE